MTTIEHLSDVEILDGLETAPHRDLPEHVEWCDPCRERVQTARRRAALQEAFTRFTAKIDPEESEARVALSDLLRHPERFDRDRSSVGLVRGLLAEIRRNLTESPSESLRQTEIALDLIQHLPEGEPDLVRLELRGETWKLRSHAFRFLARYSDALDALDCAETYYEETVTSDYGLAVIAFARAVVLREIDRLDQAERLLDEAENVFQRYGDRKRATEAAMFRGAIAFRRGDMGKAQQTWMGLLEAAETEPDLAHVGILLSNLAQCSAEIGKFGEAASLFVRAISAYDEAGNLTDKLRARWGLAQLYLRRNDYELAIGSLGLVRQSLEEAGMLEEAGLCGLDIVEACLATARWNEAERLASALVETFTAAGMNNRAIAALAFLRDAVAAKTVSHEIVEKVRIDLSHLHHEPQRLWARV
ncbi:MAG: hypothetical protein WBX15_03510 [Thermoanaerobaculia bacterium]